MLKQSEKKHVRNEETEFLEGYLTFGSTLVPCSQLDPDNILGGKKNKEEEELLILNCAVLDNLLRWSF